MNQHRSRLGAALLVLASLWGGVAGLPARAVQLADGQTYFVEPPRLDGATATQKTAYFWGSTYYFTLSLPANAGEPLQSVVISPEDGPDRARFDVSQTDAHAGDRNGTQLALKRVTQDPKTHAITVTFDPPVDPGTKITIGLYAVRNPDVGGVYMYGVTAYPRGEQSHGQFLGYGRIQIYDRYPIFGGPFFR